jgi:hypothetical protein
LNFDGCPIVDFQRRGTPADVDDEGLPGKRLLKYPCPRSPAKNKELAPPPDAMEAKNLNSGTPEVLSLIDDNMCEWLVITAREMFHRPADDAGEQVDDGGDIKPALGRPEI